METDQREWIEECSDFDKISENWKKFLRPIFGENVIVVRPDISNEDFCRLLNNGEERVGK